MVDGRKRLVQHILRFFFRKTRFSTSAGPINQVSVDALDDPKRSEKEKQCKAQTMASIFDRVGQVPFQRQRHTTTVIEAQRETSPGLKRSPQMMKFSSCDFLRRGWVAFLQEHPSTK
eukprot:1970878-Amphidinium_carterae.1